MEAIALGGPNWEWISTTAARAQSHYPLPEEVPTESEYQPQLPGLSPTIHCPRRSQLRVNINHSCQGSVRLSIAWGGPSWEWISTTAARAQSHYPLPEELPTESEYQPQLPGLSPTIHCPRRSQLRVNINHSCQGSVPLSIAWGGPSWEWISTTAARAQSHYPLPKEVPAESEYQPQLPGLSPTIHCLRRSQLRVNINHSCKGSAQLSIAWGGPTWEWISTTAARAQSHYSLPEEVPAESEYQPQLPGLSPIIHCPRRDPSWEWISTTAARAQSHYPLPAEVPAESEYQPQLPGLSPTIHCLRRSQLRVNINHSCQGSVPLSIAWGGPSWEWISTTAARAQSHYPLPAEGPQLRVNINHSCQGSVPLSIAGGGPSWEWISTTAARAQSHYPLPEEVPAESEYQPQLPGLNPTIKTFLPGLGISFMKIALLYKKFLHW